MNLTLVAYDTRDHALLMHAIRKTWQQISVVETVVFTDKPEHFPGCRVVEIEPFKSIEETSAFDVCDLPKWILENTSTSHTLHIQADGFVLNGKTWLDEWWGYDFIGAPWLFCCGRPGHQGHAPTGGISDYGHVGNDGFSLRSRVFHERVASLNIPRDQAHPADWVTSSAFAHMEGIKYAPWHVGMRFSAEDVPYSNQFGGHGQYFINDIKRQGLYELHTGIDAIRHASIDQLRDADFLADCIRDIGLEPDPRPEVFGPESVHCKGGLLQLPKELAALMVYLSDKGIRSIIDIGTFKGATISVLHAYLSRFNMLTRVVTVDPNDWHPTLPEHDIELHRGTSADFAGEYFDLAFIDGDHAYKSALYDYEHVGKNARYCVFHDIVDKFIRADYPCGGVPHLWEDIRAGRDTVEFVDHPLGLPIMGIGVIDQDVRFLVSSSQGYEPALKRLVDQLANQTDPTRVQIVVGKSDQSGDTHIYTAPYRFVSHNSFEYTALIELVEMNLPGRWFLLHDTCTIGPDFVNRVMRLPHADAVAVSLMGHNNGANGNIGLYDTRYLATKREYLDSMRNCTKQKAVTEEGRLYNDAPNRVLVDSKARMDGTTPVYGGIDRLTEYYSSVDLYKHKANWGQSPTWFTSL